MIDSIKRLFMKFYFPFFLFMSLITHSQHEMVFESKQLRSLLYTSEVLKEASDKDIKKDKALIIFYLDENCEINNFQISRPSSLESFNESIIKNKNKIIEFIKSTLDCNMIPNGKCAVPLYFITD